MGDELSTGRTLIVFSIVLGCFAVLYPKLFHPLLVGQIDSSEPPKAPLHHPTRPHVRPDRRHAAVGGGDPPVRTIERELRYELRTSKKEVLHTLLKLSMLFTLMLLLWKPGPVPGMRPTFGGPGIQPQPKSSQSGLMGVLMPLYTFGIILFFLYTLSKILFRKKDEEDERAEESERARRRRRLRNIYLNGHDRLEADTAASTDAEVLRQKLRETQRAMARLEEQVAHFQQQQQAQSGVQAQLVEPRVPPEPHSEALLASLEKCGEANEQSMGASDGSDARQMHLVSAN